MQFVFGLLLIVTAACAFAQQHSAASAAPEFPDAVPSEAQRPTATAPTFSSSANLPDAPSYTAAQRTSTNPSMQQSEWVFGVVPNSRAESPGVTPPPPSSGQSLDLITPYSAGHSSLIFVGGASASTEPSDARQHLDTGTTTSGNTCRRASADKADGSEWITSLLSITSHRSGSYCALGEGGFWKRGAHAATRAFVAHKYDGANSFNVSQAWGTAPGFATNYYPYQYYSGERLAARYASALGRDALRNMFSEFWPDIATHVLHRHP